MPDSKDKPKRRGPKYKYNWAKIQKYYDKGHSTRDIQRKFGAAKRTMELAVRRGDLVTRPQKTPIEKFLVNEVKTARHYLKKRIFAEGLMEPKCSICGLEEWRGQAIPIDLDHIDGDKTNNRLENLRPLCPNCHRQTPTFASRNWRKYYQPKKGSEKGVVLVNPEEDPEEPNPRQD